jgi:hypothetical protein
VSNPLLHAGRCVVLGDLAARFAPSLAFIKKVAKPLARSLPARFRLVFMVLMRQSRAFSLNK